MRVLVTGMTANPGGVESLATDFWACSSGAGDYFFPQIERDAAHFQLIRNAVDPAQFAFDAAARERLRASLGLADSVPLVGFVGRLQYQEHPELAIEAFRAFRTSHPSAVLALVGDGDLRAECETVATTAGMADAVRFLGIRHDTAQWYSAFDALVMPSRFEGLPLVPVEAQAASLPVVASDGVPRETAFTDLIRFLPVDAKPAVWALTLDAAMSSAQQRGPMAASVAQGGYDIATEALRIGSLFRGKV